MRLPFQGTFQFREHALHRQRGAQLSAGHQRAKRTSYARAFNPAPLPRPAAKRRQIPVARHHRCAPSRSCASLQYPPPRPVILAVYHDYIPDGGRPSDTDGRRRHASARVSRSRRVLCTPLAWRDGSIFLARATYYTFAGVGGERRGGCSSGRTFLIATMRRSRSSANPRCPRFRRIAFRKIVTGFERKTLGAIRLHDRIGRINVCRRVYLVPTLRPTASE